MGVGPLACDALADFRFGQSGALHDALHAQVERGFHQHHGVAVLVGSRFKENGGFAHRVGGGLLGKPCHKVVVHRGVHQGVDALGAFVAGEGSGGEFLALQHAVEVDSGSEFTLNRLAKRRGIGHEALGGVVGVVDGDSELFKLSGGGGFAAADGSGESDVEHGFVGVRLRR